MIETNKENYELIIHMYHEQVLSEAEIESLFYFLKEHPELMKAFWDKEAELKAQYKPGNSFTEEELTFFQRSKWGFPNWLIRMKKHQLN